MPFQTEHGPRIAITLHEHGMSIRILETDPYRRYLPVAREEFERALAEARREQGAAERPALPPSRRRA
jgi:hypothetical protein